MSNAFRACFLLAILVRIFGRESIWSWWKSFSNGAMVVGLVCSGLAIAVYLLGQWGRRWVLRNAARNHVEVIDTGSVPLLGPPEPPPETKGS